MIIGVDAGALSISDERLKVGVWRVTFNLLKELALIDEKNTYRLYSFASIDRGVMKEFGPRMQNVVLTPSVGWSSIRLPIELRIHPVDIFLGCAQLLLSSKSYNIGFIYDLAFLYAPDAYGSSYHQLKNQTDAVVARASQIITISESSKSDIINHYHLSSDRVSVCFPGVDARFTPVGKKYQFEHPYLLFVGSLNKAKDLPLAIKSFALFLKKVKKPYDFLLIGGDYWPDSRIDETIKTLHLKNRVRKLGFVPDEQLPMYYRGATAFFTTAIREGFCLPAVESMACGTPVVSVDRGAIKEVVGDGGLINPDIEPEKIADMLYALAINNQLRLRLRKQALKRAKHFSWKIFAQYVYTHMITIKPSL